MSSRLLEDRSRLRDPGPLQTPPPPLPAPGVQWPRPRPPRASPLAARLAHHAHEALQAEARAREAARSRSWPWSVVRTLEAERLGGDAATAGLLEDAVATLAAELRTAHARIERLEQTLEARSAQAVAAVLDRLLAAQLGAIRHDVRESRTALDGRMNALEAALEDRLAWLGLELDALEVRVRAPPGT